MQEKMYFEKTDDEGELKTIEVDDAQRLVAGLRKSATIVFSNG